MRLEYDPDGVRLDVRDERYVPGLSMLLGFGPMVPFVVGAIAVWALPPASAGLAAALTITWGAAILAFFSGVRRGLSFRTPGGAQPAQILTMLLFFLLALGAMVLPAPRVQTILLIIGFIAVAVTDPIAARSQEAPPFFARLRPIQMPFAVISLIAVLIHLSVKLPS